jgi:hypothetical protein
MNHIRHRVLPALLALLATGCVLAQDGGGRAPEGANQDEKRAFYQKRAAERAKAAETAAPASAAAPALTGERAIQPSALAESGNGHAHGAPTSKAMADKTAPTKPEEPARAAMRPAGMGMRGGSGALWLSDSPPARGDGPPRAGMGGMGGMSMGGDRSGPPSKRLWLRAGTDPMKSGFAKEDAEAPAEMLLVKPQGALTGEALPPPEEGKKNLAFAMPLQGYYRLYVTTRKLQGDTLNVSVAKAEVSNFSHGGDEEERTQSLTAARVLESASIEIVREKAANEPIFFQLKSGDEQAFVVLQKGLPTQGARVRFVSNEGWSKEALSDEQGRVSFQVVRDYFPPWDDFQKRFKGTYLVIADVSTTESGKHKDQPYTSVRYQATLAGSYYPATEDYRSYAWGLGVSLLIVLFSAMAVYLYRRRSIKTFREVRFNETK